MISRGCSEKYTLVLSYGTRSPGACLMKGPEVKGSELEASFIRGNTWTRIFPDNAVAELLRKEGIEMEDVSSVVLCGKPFSSLEKMIAAHMFFFPRYFHLFAAEFRDFFTNKIAIEKAINKSAQFKRSDYGILRISGRFETKKEMDERAGFKGDVYYAEPTDILAKEAAGAYIIEEGAVIVSMGDAIGARALGSYRKSGRGLERAGELLFPDSLAVLCSLEAAGSAHAVDLADIVKVYADGSFKLNSGAFEYMDGEVILKKRYAAFSREEMDAAIDGILDKIARFSKGPVPGKVVFVCDHPVKGPFREKLKDTFGEIDFIMIQRTDIMKSVGRYFVSHTAKAAEKR